MSTRTQTRFSATTLVLIAVAFLAATMVSNLLFRGVRIDLTENQLYTLSEGTKRILGSIEEPINLYFFFSDQATATAPSLRDYANRVREMLNEFANASRGKVRLSVIDPVPFSEEEDQAAQFGLQGIGLAATPDPVYLGLAGTNSIGDEEIISFFQPDREASLEYDLAKLVSTLAEPERKVVGLLSGVSMGSQFDPQTQRLQQGWVAYQQAGQLFEIRDLGLSVEAVPDDIGLLWIVQPKELDEATQYAIDQYVLRGGKALIFVDPLAIVDAAADPGMPQGMPPMGQASDLPLLFKGWGIEFDATRVVADAQLALQINTGFGNRPSRHYGYLGISSAHMSSSDIVTTELGTINAAMPGRISLADGSTATLEPLLTSSSASALMPASRFTYLPDPSSLQNGFVASGEPQIIAARIGGSLPSAFPDRDTEAHLATSAEPVNLIVVADVDMLSDHLWVQVQNFFGQQIANAFASNGAFVVNALENLAGSSDLIAVRSRGTFARPFTRVDELRVEAEARFKQTEQRLQQELAETESRLSELQSAREDTGSLLLTSEQQNEIDRFVDQRASIRKELRAVQRGLDQDIENLGTMLKIINIGLVPLLLTIATLLALWRRRRVQP